MSEAVTSAVVPSTPQFQALKNVLDQLDSAKAQLEHAQEEFDSLSREAFTLAKSIYKQGLTDDNYELAPTFCEGRSVEKVDSRVIQEMHPDIYERCHPHIDNHGIAAILKQEHGDDKLQKMLRDMNEPLWLAKSNITKAELMKHTTAAERQMLEEEGGLYTIVNFSGEIKLINKRFQNALDEQRKRFLPHADAEMEDE